MLSVYVLSFSHTLTIDNEKVQVYAWVKVGQTQVKHGMDHLPTLPKLTTGSNVNFKVVDNQEQMLRVLGDNKLRQLTKKERKNLVKSNAPIIRLG